MNLRPFVLFATSAEGDSKRIQFMPQALTLELHYIASTCLASFHPGGSGESFAIYPVKNQDGFVVFGVTYYADSSRRSRAQYYTFTREYRWVDGRPKIQDDAFVPSYIRFAVDGNFLQAELPDGTIVSTNPDPGKDVRVIPQNGGTEALAKYLYRPTDEHLAEVLRWMEHPAAARHAERTNELNRARVALIEAEWKNSLLSASYLQARRVAKSIWFRFTGVDIPKILFERDETKGFPVLEELEAWISEHGLDIVLRPRTKLGGISGVPGLLRDCYRLLRRVFVRRERPKFTGPTFPYFEGQLPDDGIVHAEVVRVEAVLTGGEKFDHRLVSE